MRMKEVEMCCFVQMGMRWVQRIREDLSSLHLSHDRVMQRCCHRDFEVNCSCFCWLFCWGADSMAELGCHFTVAVLTRVLYCTLQVDR